MCVYKRHIEARLPNHFCTGKAISITYPDFVSAAFFMQHAMLMRHITLLPVACLAVPCFSTLSPKRHDFRKNAFEHKMCFDFLCETCPK
jgi:hypothetical protein